MNTPAIRTAVFGICACLPIACAAPPAGEGEEDPRPPPGQSGLAGARPAAQPEDARPADLVTAGAMAALDADTNLRDIVPPSAPAPPAPGVVPLFLFELGGKAPPRDADKIPGRLRVIVAHDGTHANPGTLPAAHETPIGVDVHGNTSAGYEKQSFNLELRDEAGMDREVALLGLPKESDWVLHACYADKTCVRNALAFALGRQTGRWAPRTRYVEVFLDGKYHGLYLLMEKITRAVGRVEIHKPAADASGDLSGGYVVKIDSPSDGPGTEWQSATGQLWAYSYPKAKFITAGQKSALRASVDRLEAALKGPAFADPKVGYRAITDVPSFIDFMLLTELVNNVDAYWRSSYFHKQSDASGGRFLAGPLWDFDLAWGNADFRDSFRTDVWALETQARLLAGSKYGRYLGIFDAWKRLWSDPEYQRALRCRWRELRQGPFATPAIGAQIDGFVREMGRAEARDHARWPVLGKRVWPNKFVGKTYAEEIAYLKSWITERAAWMDRSLPASCP